MLEGKFASNNYDIVILDINSNDISPPVNFLEDAFLEKLVSLAKEGTGYVAINTLIYQEDKKKEIYNKF